MKKFPEYQFSAEIKIIGINPYVSLPDSILQSIFLDAEKDKGPLPIKGTINRKPYVQNLVKYAGAWRLYINTNMLESSPKRIGEKINITISFDPVERRIEMHDELKKALAKNETAKSVFEKLSPSRQNEINKYLATLKTEERVNANIDKVINYLLGNKKFLGRDIATKR